MAYQLISGSTNSDVLWGPSTPAIIKDLGGDDSVFAGAGSDIRYGGDGDYYYNYGSPFGVHVSLTISEPQDTGNALANTLTGNSGDDLLETAANKDTLTDFQHGVDKIAIDTTQFAAFLGGDTGFALSPANFALGTTASTATQYLIYDQPTGALLYDADGAGGAAAVQIAVLSSRPVLDAGDFLLI